MHRIINVYDTKPHKCDMNLKTHQTLKKKWKFIESWQNRKAPVIFLTTNNMYGMNVQK